jgi:hypothetical protein
MSTLTKILGRLTVLETASASAVKPPTLADYTEAMKRATKEEAIAWIRACQELMDLHPEAFPDREGPAAAKKGPSVKKPSTNSSGPTEWNLKVKEVQCELAELAGVDYASFFDGVGEDETAQKKAQDAFNKAAGAVGAGWQIAMKEASIRKKMEEKDLSREDAEAEAAAEAEKKTEKKAARKGSIASAGSDSASVASAPAPAEKPLKAKKAKEAVSLAEAAGLEGEAEPKAKAKKEKKAKKVVDLRKQQLEEAGLIEKEIDGQLYIIEPESGEAFFPGEDGEILGERAGVYDADLEIVDTEA